jgi:hypothetical protein
VTAGARTGIFSKPNNGGNVTFRTKRQRAVLEFE